MNSKKATIYDIAEMTGYSIGTINRALTGKERIRKETRDIILDAAKKLGFKANEAAQGLHRSPIRIGVILYCQVFEYVDAIRRGFEAKAAELEKFNVHVDIHEIPYTTNDECRREMLEKMRYYSQNGYNGIAFFPSSTRTQIQGLDKLIDEITDNGIAIATVAADIQPSSRALYVGIDAFTAGRMAAEMLHLICPGKEVALLTSTRDSEINSGYIEGFFDYAGENTFSAVRMYEHYDEPELVLSETERMINENPSLSDIYMTTANATRACQHIERITDKRYTIITTDLLNETSSLLSSGMAAATIFQDPYKQGSDALGYLYEYITSKESGGVHLITPSIILSSNVNCYKI